MKDEKFVSTINRCCLPVANWLNISDYYLSEPCVWRAWISVSVFEKTVYTINLQLCKCINWKLFFFSTSITTCIITNFSLVKNSWNCDINHFVCEWIFPCDPIMRFCSFWNCVSKTLLLSRKQMVCSRFFFFLLYILIYCMCVREREGGLGV